VSRHAARVTAVAVLLLAALSMACGAGRSRRVTHDPCWDPGPASDDVRDMVRELVTDTTAGGDGRRRNWQLPRVAASEVQIVRDDRACARMVVARGVRDVTSVLLIRVGPTRYVVWDGLNSGEFTVYHVYDQDFKHLIGLTG
jgi:hypothetical protein